MVHDPKRSSVFGNRKLGDLGDREGPRKAVGNQNDSSGRYDVNEEKKVATKKALSKIQTNKTMTGNIPSPVVQDPDKPDAIGRNYN
jgi:hypothetical protein